MWNGGLSFHGGLLGAIVSSLIYCKIKNIGFYTLADILVIPSALFLALGRIANLINQEILGKITSSSFCINFEGLEGCRYPIQVYSAIGRFALFLILFKLQKTGKKQGFLFYIFIFLISLGRFLLDFFREDVLYFYLTMGQWFSLILVLVSGFILAKKYLNQSH